MIVDMHAHLACLSDEYKTKLSESEKLAMAGRELDLRAQHGILTCVSSGTPGEWEFLRSVGKPVLTSFGIHPWYSDRYEPEDYRRYFTQCDVIGETGMDSVWCEVPLQVQRRVFERQLELAAELKKPVILHTKGQEREIAEMIRDFPQKVCVHWYSGDLETFERFRELDCYFTLGPDLASDPEMRYHDMLKALPPERLFVETDGISAVAWARGVLHLGPEEIPGVLTESMTAAAAAKRMPVQEIERRMLRNLREFLGQNGGTGCGVRENK
jgi:TatD DNase family protein